MAISVGGNKGLENEINVVPMIDILLVLLIIFMAALPSMRKAIDIQLPDPNPTVQPANPQSNQIVLEVNPGGQFSINTEKVDKGNLGPRLKEIYDPRPEKIIFVKRSEERRVGKECRSRWTCEHSKKNTMRMCID